MAGKPKKANSKKSTPKKAPATPEETKDLSLDDLESVTGGLLTFQPVLTTAKLSAACVAPITAKCASPPPSTLVCL